MSESPRSLLNLLQKHYESAQSKNTCISAEEVLCAARSRVSTDVIGVVDQLTNIYGDCPASQLLEELQRVVERREKSLSHTLG